MVAKKHHRPIARVVELIEGPTGDQACHAGLQHGLAAIREVHGALALDDVEGAIRVVAVHLVLLSRLQVDVKEGIEARAVHERRPPRVGLSRHLLEIDDLDGHPRPPPAISYARSDYMQRGDVTPRSTAAEGCRTRSFPRPSTQLAISATSRHRIAPRVRSLSI